MSQTNMQTLAHKSLTVRAARSVIKKELREESDKHAALRMAAEHIADPAPELAGMTVYDLISAGRGCGQAVTFDLLGGLRIGAHTKIGQRGGEAKQSVLTERQREDLAAALRDPTARTRAGWHSARPARPVAAVMPVLTPEPDTQGPGLATWCPRCADYAIAMRNGTCGWCDTKIGDAAA